VSNTPVEYHRVSKIIAVLTLTLANSPQYEKYIPHFQRQSDICFCVRSALLLLRDGSQSEKTSVQWAMPHYSWSFPIPHASLSWSATDATSSRMPSLNSLWMRRICADRRNLVGEHGVNFGVVTVTVHITFSSKIIRCRRGRPLTTQINGLPAGSSKIRKRPIVCVFRHTLLLSLQFVICSPNLLLTVHTN
jgi:hypothetical protein